MSFHFGFYRNCATLLVHYKGEIPFHLYLKDHFKKNKNWGSNDRKKYRACCYFFWRFALDVSRENEATVSLWLQNNYLENSDLIPTHSNLTENKVVGLNSHAFDSFKDILGLGIDAKSLNQWFTKEPYVWLRVLSGKRLAVERALEKLNVKIVQVNGDAIAVESKTPLNSILETGYAYVQDIGSQLSMEWKNLPLQASANSDDGILDVCAGAGGKSITLLQNFPNAKIVCTDVRASILENLKMRFQQLRLPSIQTAVLDFSISQIKSPIAKKTYGIVMADVPCSGSGTWRRNPENLHFFDAMQIDYYATIQLNIAVQASKLVKLGGFLVYLTCSVFKQENESNIAKLVLENPEFLLIDSQYFGGINQQGDYIYRAVLKRIS